MRTPLLLAAVFCVACPRGDDPGLPDSDVPSDTGVDPDRPLPDSDAPHTDTDEPPHTDPPAPDDSGSDTFQPVDTSDTAAGPVEVWTTIPNVHAGIHRPGDLLKIPGVVVTALRRQRQPPASNAFVVQDPTATRKGGLYIHVRDLGLLPEVGDVVTVAGVYEEVGVGTPPTGTLARLTIHASLTGTWFTVDGVGVVPLPQAVTVADLRAPEAEHLESMLVRLAGADTNGLTVTRLPSLTWHDFPVSTDGGTTHVDVVPWFHDLRDDFSPSPGDTLTSLTGILYWQGTDFNLAPRSASDAEGIVDH